MSLSLSPLPLSLSFSPSPPSLSPPPSLSFYSCVGVFYHCLCVFIVYLVRFFSLLYFSNHRLVSLINYTFNVSVSLSLSHSLSLVGLSLTNNMFIHANHTHTNCGVCERIMMSNKLVQHSKCCTILPNIPLFIHPFTHPRRRQPCEATTSSPGAVRVRRERGWREEKRY